MAQTIEDVNGRTLLQQFHSLYKKQNQTETDVENLGTKIDQETVDRQTADLNLNAEIDTLREQIESLGVLFTYKGEVATIQDLPLTNNTPGDVYYVESDQSEYIWLEKSGVYQWEQFGPAIDLSAYAKQEDLEQLQNDVNSMNTQVENNASNIVSLTNTKQDKLTAGTNITIDSNNVISASGSGSGGQLYEHNIIIQYDEGVTSYRVRAKIYTRTQNTFTYNDLVNYIKNNNFYNKEFILFPDYSWTPAGTLIFDVLSYADNKLKLSYKRLYIDSNNNSVIKFTPFDAQIPNSAIVNDNVIEL